MDTTTIKLSFDEKVILMTALNTQKEAISGCTDDYIRENMPPLERLIEKIQSARIEHI